MDETNNLTFFHRPTIGQSLLPLGLVVLLLALIIALTQLTGLFFYPSNEPQRLVLSSQVGCGITNSDVCYDGVSQAAALDNDLRFAPVSCNQIKECATFHIAGASGSNPAPTPTDTTPDHLKPQRVLIIANQNSTSSVAVANYYQQRRNVPLSNVCLVDVPDVETARWDDFLSLKHQVSDCIDASPNTIYYLLTTYGVPYLVNMDGSGRIGDEFANALALDSMLTLVAVDDENLPDPFHWQASTLEVLNKNPYYAGGGYADQVSLSQPRQPFGPGYMFGGVPFYLVTRLDGPSAAVAMGLVDKAIAAEAQPMTGNICLDMVGPIGRLSFLNNQILKAYFAAESFGQSTIIDRTNAVIGNATAGVSSCPDIMAYAGTYNNEGYFADALDWQPGSVAVPLHSVNAKSLRSLSNPNIQEQWVAAALNDGLTGTVASAAEPLGPNLMRSSIFTHYWLKGYNFASAAYASIPYVFFTELAVGDPLFHITLPPSLCTDNDDDYFGTCGYPVDCNDANISRHPSPQFDWQYLDIATFDLDQDGIPDYDKDGDGYYGCVSYQDCCDDCNDYSPASHQTAGVVGPQCVNSFTFTSNVYDQHRMWGGWVYQAGEWFWINADINHDGTSERYWRYGLDYDSYHDFSSGGCQSQGLLLTDVSAQPEYGLDGTIMMIKLPEPGQLLVCRNGNEEGDGPLGVVFTQGGINPPPANPWQ